MFNEQKIFNWESLPEMFFKEAKKQLDKPLLWHKINNKYKHYSWGTVKNKINLLSLKLIKLGLKKGVWLIVFCCF